jgi:hypothetical protein
MKNNENSCTKNKFSLNWRVDCIVVWGHGIQYANEILNIIRNTEGLTILHIEKRIYKNIKNIINKIYAFDYAPLVHLKSKIKYLQSIEPVVMFIFLKNHYPDEDYYGEYTFRHIESNLIRKLKEDIRSQFNPREKSGVVSHEHVIHATDNELQTDSILKLIGYKDGLCKFREGDKYKIIKTPHYLEEPNYFTIENICYKKLYCGNAVSKNNTHFVKIIKIQDSVQYLSLFNEEIYHCYINKFRGTILRQDYNINRYFSLKKNFLYLNSVNSTNYIVVKKYQKDSYIILDGLHRAALHYYAGNVSIKACIYE